MELDGRLKDEITRIFGTVEYGRITFFLSPDKKTLDYTIETAGKVPIPGRETNSSQIKARPREMIRA